MNIDEYIRRVNTTVDGEYIKVLHPEAFKAQLESFKEVAAKVLPQFTLDEIVKHYRFSQELNTMLDWYNIEYLITAIELENE